MKQKIANKIVFTIAILSFILFGVLAFDDIYSRQKELLPLFVARGEAVARSLEASITNEEEMKNQDRLASIIQKNLWLDSEIINISFHLPQDNGLKVYASSIYKEIGTDSNNQNKDSFNQNRSVNQTDKTVSSEKLVITAPIHIGGQVSGTVQIDFSLNVINQQITEDLIEEIVVKFSIL